MGVQTTKVFIISLDGATFSVLYPLAKQGCLPNLSQMMTRGLTAELESVAPPVTAPAWTSFMTGKHPGKHGIFDFTRFDPSDYSWGINSAQHIRSKTLWQILSEKGKRVIVLNLPYTYPPYEIDGVMVSGWDAPSSETVFSYPSAVSNQILDMFPDYKSNLWVSEIMPRASDAEFAEFTHKLKLGFEQQTKVALQLLEKEDWDVFMVHFQQTDWIQHKLWTYIERACRDSDDKSSKVEAARDCYRRFDELAGVLQKRVEPMSPLRIVLSDHGFGRLMGSIYPNFYLKGWGYLAPAAEAKDGLKTVKDLFRKSRFPGLRSLYRTLAGAKNAMEKRGSARKYQSWADNAGDTLAGRQLLVDWKRTKVATVWAYQMGFLYVNLVGRGPMGIVEPGPEYESLVTELISKFREISHPNTGEKLLKQVARGRDTYPEAGDGILLPDVVLVPVDGYGFAFTISDAPPEISEEGSHRHDGVLLLEGKGLKQSLPNFRPELVDLAPTILHALGLPVPADMDGRVLEEIFNEGRRVQYEEVDNSVVQKVKEYTEEEAGLIEQRLKGLGYLE